MYNGILQTDIVVWFGVSEPMWDEDDWEEEDQLSLSIVKKRRKGNWSISKSKKIRGDFSRDS